jgi:alpha-glucosidase
MFVDVLRFWLDRGADGFRVDVAHGLAKNLVDPLATLAHLGHEALPDGTHPLWDRDEVHDIYAEWRKVFNEYTPPRMAVAEAWVQPLRRRRYASPQGLGQAFNFDLLRADFDAGEFRQVITEHLDEARQTGASSTWVLSNHDVIRHPTRYGLPSDGKHEIAEAWLSSNSGAPELDRDLGLRRARAATLLLLALPGSAYLYQGEELGLHEVGDLPAAVLQDPVFRRSGGLHKGRDGCRVPLPWTASGPSYGFGAGPAHLPQPTWFGAVSVEVQESDPASTLRLYRSALAARRQMQAAETLDWIEGGSPTVLHFARPGHWQCVTNFGTTAVPLPHGALLLASGPLDGDQLPPNTTAWLR